ncbi:hypothetical protein D4740_06890 [Actinomyces sp. 2119]|uniref:hypothetical protein n=1 Tax=Actinomyces sp. 2119 TaxID=2321393 RepID=UPI000E6D3326|nr:hypothetical protein [Actinomyces sp. 2119]RJF40527.1 hypothetical protein D4740_11845 [Actinomyces sp. 2119]RJF41812.1 hypothetical protein D4740_06890 [Actinomyces sp. 2119]
MPTYAHYRSQLEALTERLRVYLDRLEARAREYTAQAASVTAGLQVSDPGAAQEHRAEVRRTVMYLHTKAQRTFDQHLAPFGRIDDDHLTPQERAALENLLETARAMVGDFRTRLERVVDGAPTRSRPGLEDQATDQIPAYQPPEQPRQDLAQQDLPYHDVPQSAGWDRAVEDWRLAQASFTCQRCGTRVPLPELYHVAVYLTCPGCGSRVVFQPSPAMQAAPEWAEELAQEQAAPQRRRYEEQTAQESAPGMRLVHDVYYRLAWFHALSSMLPFYARTRRQAFLGELGSCYQPQSSPQSSRYAEMEYVNIIGSFGDYAAVLRQQGLAAHLELLLAVVRSVMRPGDALAHSVLEGTYTEAAYQQRADAALRLPDALPR